MHRDSGNRLQLLADEPGRVFDFFSAVPPEMRGSPVESVAAQRYPARSVRQSRVIGTPGRARHAGRAAFGRYARPGSQRGRWIRSVNLAFRCGVMTRPALDTTESLASLSKARLRAWLSDGGGHGGAGWAAGPGGPGSGSYDSGLRHHDGQQGQG